MARPKKNGTYLNVCIETPIYERLENFCKDAGHTKTVAVERALISYFDEYEEMKKKLKELESKDKYKGYEIITLDTSQERLQCTPVHRK